MSIDPLSDEKVIDSWLKNATPWTVAIREGRIESRRLVTNDAIVQTILECSTTAVLDIGCCEGWLARALAESGIRVTGVDVVPKLIDQARAAGGGDFRVASYEEIAAGALDLRVDLAVANFALIGGKAVDELLRALPSLLTSRGWLVIQTLHPVVGTGDQPYVDGWRPGSWTGFSTDFTDAAPWYFRTIESWVTLLRSAGFHLERLVEPVHPLSGKPASAMFVCRVAA